MYDLNTYVDRIFYINLDDRPERNSSILAEFQKAGLWNYERVPGVVVEKVPANHGIMGPWATVKDMDKYIRGALGCLYAHKNIIQEAQRRGYKKICIFEDDAILCENFSIECDRFLSELEKEKWQYQIAYLGLVFPPTPSEIGCANTLLYHVHKYAYGTFAYIINDMSWVFRLLLENIEYSGSEIDLIYNNLIMKDYLSQVYLSNPMLAVQSSASSSILEREKNSFV